MFDYENQFVQANQISEDPVETDWENAEWERIVDDPRHRAECDQRAADREAEDADRETRVANFHARRERRRKKLAQRTAYRFALLAMASGLLAYACGYYGINWLCWIIGIAAASFAITSSYGFGRVYEMG